MVSCGTSSITLREDTFTFNGISTPIHQPVILRVDQAFSERERGYITSVLRSWAEASQGKVKFIVYWKEQKPGYFHEMRVPPDDQGFFLWRVKKQSDIHMTDGLRRQFTTVHGLFTPSKSKKSANLVVFAGSFEESHFVQVIAHEIGHLLGLNHVYDVDATMNVHNESECINESDIIQLCYLYNCEVPKEPMCIKLGDHK